MSGTVCALATHRRWFAFAYRNDKCHGIEKTLIKQDIVVQNITTEPWSLCSSLRGYISVGEKKANGSKNRYRLNYNLLYLWLRRCKTRERFLIFEFCLRRAKRNGHKAPKPMSQSSSITKQKPSVLMKLRIYTFKYSSTMFIENKIQTCNKKKT